MYKVYVHLSTGPWLVFETDDIDIAVEEYFFAKTENKNYKISIEYDPNAN